MVKPLNINKIIETLEVKAIIIALAINTILSYWLSSYVPDMLSIGISTIMVGLSAYYLSGYFSKRTIFHSLIIGAWSFSSYVLALRFFNLIEETLATSDVVTSAIIFGVLYTIVLKILERKK